MRGRDENFRYFALRNNILFQKAVKITWMAKVSLSHKFLNTATPVEFICKELRDLEKSKPKFDGGHLHEAIVFCTRIL